MRELARGMGSATSDAKAAAARENGKKGGRPRKQAAESADRQPPHQCSSTARMVAQPAGDLACSPI
jgi:hypothetical protein